VTTVGQFHELRVRVVFGSEENLRDFVFVALSALLRASFPAQTDTGMLARKTLLTRPVTAFTIAKLSTQLSASLMLALPGAFLIAWLTRLPTFFLALAVSTGVTAGFFAWRTVFSARLLTGVATEQGAGTA